LVDWYRIETWNTLTAGHGSTTGRGKNPRLLSSKSGSLME
jgi:hypothetical protein